MAIQEYYSVNHDTLSLCDAIRMTPLRLFCLADNDWLRSEILHGLPRESRDALRKQYASTVYGNKTKEIYIESTRGEHGKWCTVGHLHYIINAFFLDNGLTSRVKIYSIGSCNDSEHVVELHGVADKECGFVAIGLDETDVIYLETNYNRQI